MSVRERRSPCDRPSPGFSSPLFFLLRERGDEEPVQRVQGSCRGDRKHKNKDYEIFSVSPYKCLLVVSAGRVLASFDVPGEFVIENTFILAFLLYFAAKHLFAVLVKSFTLFTVRRETPALTSASVPARPEASSRYLLELASWSPGRARRRRFLP